MKKILSPLITIWAVLLATACTSDLYDTSSAGETSIVVTASRPKDGIPVTRAKTDFVAGDIIYLTGKITTTVSATPIIISSVMRTSDGNQWILDETFGDFSWPENSVSGVFTAYYLPGNPTVEAAGTTLLFQDLTEASDDPLVAATDEIAAGGAVHLQFAHMLTKLYIHGINEENAATLSSEKEIATGITFTPTEQGYSYSYNRKGKSFRMKGNTDKQATFFLHVDESWKDNSFFLQVTPNEPESGSAERLSLEKVKLHTMKAERAYYFGYGSWGINAQLEEQERWFKDRLTERKFYRSEEITTYFTNLSSATLTENLNFNNIEITTPISLSAALEGNYKIIRNIRLNGTALFTTGQNISNLTLENVTLSATAENPSNGEAIGLLLDENSHTLTNVHLSGYNRIGTNGYAYVGGLVGRNNGTISQVSATGSLIIESYVDLQENLYVGGLIGCNGFISGSNATGVGQSLSACTVSAAATITAAGKTIANAYIGGLLGYNAVVSEKTDQISDCSATTQVDASLLTATSCHVGGFIGENLGKLKSCSASGSVTGGMVTTGIAATGGFIGHAYSPDEKRTDFLSTINNCHAAGITKSSSITGNVYTGGLAGFVETDLKNCSSTGTVLTGGTIGALTGMISADKVIYNSFSMSTCSNSSHSDFRLSGLRPDTKARNCHYNGYLLKDNGETTTNKATAIFLNNAVNDTNEYLTWSNSPHVHDGAPYLIKLMPIQ